MDETLKKVYRASLKFLTPMSMEETYRVITNEALKLVKAEFGSVFLYTSDEFRRVYASNPNLYKITVRKKGYTYKVFKKRKPVILNYEEIRHIPRKRNYAHHGIDYRSDLIVPLSYHGKSLGVLSIISEKKDRFSQKDVNTLTLFIPLATLAIRKAQLNNEIETALESRDLFISMASHELRTPLTAVNGYINLIQSKLNKHKGDSLSRWVESLAAESLRLTLLVKELLEVNRIKVGKLHYYFKECPLIEIVNRAISSFKFTNQGRVVKSAINIKEGEDRVIGDYDKLLQCLTNLLENAAKFSKEMTEIRVNLMRRKGDLVISVEDQGIGIKKEELSTVLKNFIRGSNAQKEGMGLGLYMVNEIVAQHNGILNIKSKLNKGTKIEICLPRAKI